MLLYSTRIALLRWVFGLYLLGILGWLIFQGLTAISVAASTDSVVRVRALLPQPESPEIEWILLEKVGQLPSTTSAQVRDTHGSVKSSFVPLLHGQDWYWLTASQSAITLNNDMDAVEIFLEGEFQDRSATYSASRKSQVWTRLDSGWQWLDGPTFWNRWEERDWSSVATASAATPSSQSPPPKAPLTHPEISPAPANEPERSEKGVTPKLNPPKPYLGVLPQLLPLSQTVQTTVLEPTFKEDPATLEELLSQEEVAYSQRLLGWKQGATLFFCSGFLWLNLLLPLWFERLKRVSWRRWSWSLLS